MSTPVNAAEPKTGPWHAWFDSPGGELPFGMILQKTDDGWASQIINGPERIKVPTSTWDGNELVLDIDYYDAKVAPYIDGKNVEYLGLLSQKELAPVYRKAAAVLFMINWCEPCSMVGIETQASGTPLIGTRFGYLPEIIKDGETGFLVDTVDEAVGAVGRLDALSPADCRENIETRFSVPAMAKGYEAVYRSLVNR